MDLWHTDSQAGSDGDLAGMKLLPNSGVSSPRTDATSIGRDSHATTTGSPSLTIIVCCMILTPGRPWVGQRCPVGEKPLDFFKRFSRPMPGPLLALIEISHEVGVGTEGKGFLVTFIDGYQCKSWQPIGCQKDDLAPGRFAKQPFQSELRRVQRHGFQR